MASPLNPADEEKIESTIESLKKKNCVIALGGGAFVNKNIRNTVLKNAISVWLDINLKTLNMRTRWNKQPGLDFLSAHLIDYPSPTNLGYLWGIGSTAGLCLGIQLATGIFLAMHYTANVDLAFASVEHIMRDVNNG